MEILSYIGYGLMALLACITTYSVRAMLGMSHSTIMLPITLLAAAISLPISGFSLNHSWWLIPAAYVVMFIALKIEALRFPLLFPLMVFVTEIFSGLIRIGIPPERVQAARRQAWANAIKQFTPNE